MDVESHLYTIYRITNLVNGKSYIGRTANIQRRWAAHRYPKRSATMLIARAVRKYGYERFVFEELANTYSREASYEIERILIAYWGTTAPKGYNRLPGGEGGGVLGHAVSPDTRLKIRLAQLGQKRRPLTTEEKRARSLRQKGRKFSPEHVAKIRLAHLGKKRSEQARKNISDGHKGLKHSPEQIAKIRAHRHTAEVRALIAAASKAQWRTRKRKWQEGQLCLSI